MIGAMRIGVYGLGRFGAFWANCLAEKFEVYGYSRNPKRVTSGKIVRVSEEELLSCDTIFLCVSISSMEEVVRRISEQIKRDATIIDTCSVKVYPVEVMVDTLPAAASIIGTHPMFGPDSGKAGIVGLPLVYCPIRAGNETQKYWLSVFNEMGLSVYQLTPEEHDREAAYTQGITHFMGRVLDDLHLEKSEIGTLGYQKLLDIIEQTCNDPYQLFLDLQRYNPFTGEMRRKLKVSILKMQTELGDANA